MVVTPVFLDVLLCRLCAFLTRETRHRLTVRHRACTASFPADYLFKGSSSPSDYLFFAVICSTHCEGVRSLVEARQTHFIQSDRAINCKVEVKFNTLKLRTIA